MASMKDDTSSLTVGEGVVVLRRKGRQPVTAAVLGEQRDYPKQGLKTLWLDRIVHQNEDNTLGGFPVHGAFVTEVVMPMQAAGA